MLASPLTLSEYVADEDWAQVLVEHARCGAYLGIHLAYRYPNDPVFVQLARSGSHRNLGRSPLAQPFPPTPGVRGPLTAPGIGFDSFDRQAYARVFCSCLPYGHAEKLRIEKVGELPVTFPEWKWGRPIDIPVVTI